MFTCVVGCIVSYGDKLIRSRLYVTSYSPPRCRLLSWLLQNHRTCIIDNVGWNFFSKLPLPCGERGTDKLWFVKTRMTFEKSSVYICFLFKECFGKVLRLSKLPIRIFSGNYFVVNLNYTPTYIDQQ